MKKLIILLLLLTSNLLAAIALDQSQPTYTVNIYLQMRVAASVLWNANSFVPTVTAICDKITIRLSKVGLPTGHVYLTICADNAGKPGTPLIGSNSVDVATLSTDQTNGALVDFGFGDAPPALVANTKYWFKYDGDYAISNVNYAQIFLKTPGGSTFGYYNGSSFVTPYVTADACYFEYYVVPVTITHSHRLYTSYKKFGFR
jgi:hypothetical protein